MERELVANVPATELGQWTGYLTNFGGQYLTIDALAVGPVNTTVMVTLAYPADASAKPIQVQLLKESHVGIYR